MPKLLQINECLHGSTGKIARQIGDLAVSKGWESWITYSAREPIVESKSKTIKVGSMLSVYEHYAENRFLCGEGLASRCATEQLINKIDKIKPDVIQIHNIHDHFLNFPILFRYLSNKNFPIVWTQHDLWAATGYCAFSLDGCEKWKTGCQQCPELPKFCIDWSKRNFNLKKASFTSVKNMTLVPVSEWLGIQLQQSFLKNYPIQVIKNGVDISLFKPIANDISEKYGLTGKHILLGVSSVWNKSKGVDDFIALSKSLPKEYYIVLVGLTKGQMSGLPQNIIGIERTDSQLELAQLYSAADIVLSLSYFETFGLTIAEGMACGTPAIVYDNAALPELITSETGRVVESGNLNKLQNTILEMVSGNFKEKYSEKCRLRALEVFDKNKIWKSYISLYDKLLVGGVK